jgi:hypothetical protein
MSCAREQFAKAASQRANVRTFQQVDDNNGYEATKEEKRKATL